MRFEEFARLHGLIIDIAYPSERIRRCGTEDHPRSKNGAYFYDGRRGWVRVWDGGGETQWWNDPDAKPWTEADKAKWRAKRQAELKAIALRHKRAAERAHVLVGSCHLDTHMYLVAKGLGDVKTLVGPEGEMMIPMRAFHSNRLVGVQFVRWEPEHTDEDGEVVKAGWNKKMQYGIDGKLAVLRLGDPRAPLVWLCEGFATGLSIAAALESMHLRAQVIVCFSDHNMVEVAQHIPGKKYVFADHDKSGAGLRAATKIGAPYVMSPKLGEDANDLHQRAGLMEVCRLILEAHRQ